MNLDERSFRPLVTFAVFGYNQEKYIHDAIQGALAQTYSPIEFLFSDDCSTDRTFEIMEEYARDYRGTALIRLNRNRENIGLTAHLNVVNKMASGEILVYAAGDDVSMPNRTTTLVEQFMDVHSPSLVMSNAMLFNNDGQELGPLNPGESKLIKVPRVHPLDVEIPGFNGCTVSVRREMVHSFGTIMKDLIAEDPILVRRAALLNGIAYIPECLVKYRIHGESISKREIETRKEYLEDLTRWLNDIDLQYKQLELDIESVSSLEKVDPHGKIGVYRESNRRRMRIVKGGFFEGLIAIFAEFVVLKDYAVLKEVSRMFVIRWFPSLMGYSRP
jgi:glycosyltransferase involved in cell wall biosynthesis